MLEPDISLEEEVFRNWNELISVHKHKFDRLEVEVSKPVIVSCGTYPSWLEAGGGGGWRGGAGGERAGGERAGGEGLEGRLDSILVYILLQVGELRTVSQVEVCQWLLRYTRPGKHYRKFSVEVCVCVCVCV